VVSVNLGLPVGRRHTLQKLVPETCTRNLRENLTQVHHSFLHQNNSPESSQSRCTVRVTCQTVSVLVQSCAQLRVRNLLMKKLVQDWPTHVRVSCTRWLAHVSGTTYKFLAHVSPVWDLILTSVSDRPGVYLTDTASMWPPSISFWC